MNDIFRVFNFRQEDHELVTSLTADGIHATHAPRQTGSHRLQQLITDHMTERIVDVFEIIHIHVEQCYLLALPAGYFNRPGQPVSKQQTIWQSGQKVVLRQMRHSLRQGLCFGDVLQDDHSTGNLASGIVDRRRNILDQQFDTMAPKQRRTLCQSDGPVFVNGTTQRVVGCLSG